MSTLPVLCVLAAALVPLSTSQLYYSTGVATTNYCYQTTWYVYFYYRSLNYYTNCPYSSCTDEATKNSCCTTLYLNTIDGKYYQQCQCDSTAVPNCNSLAAAPEPATTTTSTTTTTTSTTTTTPTTTSTTTTTTTPTTTTTTPTTTTTTPTTTTTTPTTTTTTPTTTSTTTTSTTAIETTTSFISLCDQYRLLGGTPVTDTCLYQGVANITALGGTTPVCNAVYTSANINGDAKTGFLTSQSCTETIKALQDGPGNMMFVVNIGSQTYPILEPILTIVEGEDGNAFIEIADSFSSLFDNMGCQTEACAYNPTTMVGEIDFTDCKIISYGVSDAATLSVNGAHETALTLNPFSCNTVDELFGADDTLCFTTISGDYLYCSFDSGAPIYCKAKSNGENILMGVTGLQTACDATPHVKLLPFPA